MLLILYILRTVSYISLDDVVVFKHFVGLWCGLPEARHKLVIHHISHTSRPTKGIPATLRRWDLVNLPVPHTTDEIRIAIILHNLRFSFISHFDCDTPVRIIHLGIATICLS